MSETARAALEKSSHISGRGPGWYFLVAQSTPLLVASDLKEVWCDVYDVLAGVSKKLKPKLSWYRSGRLAPPN